MATHHARQSYLIFKRYRDLEAVLWSFLSVEALRLWATQQQALPDCLEDYR